MAIKAGQILHVANQFVVDRIQTGGPGNLDIPQEKIYELGNYQSVGVVRDVPELTFSLECLEVDTEVEALITRGTVSGGAPAPLNPYDAPQGTKYELAKNKPIDVVSPWKAGLHATNPYQIVRGVALPNLFLETASYRYGLTDNAGTTFSLRGDSIFYIPGSPYQDITTTPAPSGTPATLQTVYPFANGPALLYREGGQNIYALSVSVNGERKVRGHDYDETATGVTFRSNAYVQPPAQGSVVSIVYGSATPATYPQTGNTTYGGGTAGSNTGGAGHLVHQGTTVKPAAIRGKDIDVYFSTLIPMVGVTGPNGAGGTYDPAGTPTAVEVRWDDVQSATLEWRVTLEEDREFGNPRAIGREPNDVPVTNGTIEVKPRSVETYYNKLRQISGINNPDQIIGPQSSITGALRIELRNPDSGGTTATATPAGTVLKTHYVPDARFTMPGYEGRVNTKYTTTMNWEGDSGALETFKGTIPTS